MAKDLNKVMLTGNLGADPETRFTPQGTQVVTFRVASNRQTGPADNRREETEWFRVSAWDRLGATCADHLRKGSRVLVEGRLKTTKWQDKETGQDRYSTEVVAEEVIFLGEPRGRNGVEAREEVEEEVL